MDLPISITIILYIYTPLTNQLIVTRIIIIKTDIHDHTEQFCLLLMLFLQIYIYTIFSFKNCVLFLLLLLIKTIF